MGMSTTPSAFRVGLFTEARKAPPCLFVLFGVTGDLAARKIAPALYNLYRDAFLDERTTVVGVGRRPLSSEQFHGEMLAALKAHSRSQPVEEGLWDRLAGRWHYRLV